MRVHDLLGDRKAEARILAKAVLRPIGIEALKHFLESVGPHARTVIIDIDFDIALQPPAGDAHRASRRRERARILDQIVDDLAEAGIASGHLECTRTAAFETQCDAHTVVALHFVGDRNNGIEELRNVNRRGFLALQFGVQAAGVGNVGDQPIEPFDIVLNDGEQAPAALVVLATGNVSTAERSDVSGFFSSCATSAAKLSIASIRL